MNAVLRLISRRGEPSQRTRRILVVLGVIGIAAVGRAMMLSEASPGNAIPLVAITGLLALIPLFPVTEFRRNVLRRVGRASADERERQRADEAYRLSYRFIEFGAAGTALLFAFAAWFESLPNWSWFAVWFVLLQFVIFLPYFVFAWREPDGVSD